MLVLIILYQFHKYYQSNNIVGHYIFDIDCYLIPLVACRVNCNIARPFPPYLSRESENIRCFSLIQRKTVVRVFTEITEICRSARDRKLDGVNKDIRPRDDTAICVALIVQCWRCDLIKYKKEFQIKTLTMSLRHLEMGIKYWIDISIIEKVLLFFLGCE